MAAQGDAGHANRQGSSRYSRRVSCHLDKVARHVSQGCVDPRRQERPNRKGGRGGRKRVGHPGRGRGGAENTKPNNQKPKKIYICIFHPHSCFTHTQTDKLKERENIVHRCDDMSYSPYARELNECAPVIHHTRVQLEKMGVPDSPDERANVVGEGGRVGGGDWGIWSIRTRTFTLRHSRSNNARRPPDF